MVHNLTITRFAAVFLKKNPQPSYVVSCRNMEWYYALEVRMLFNDNDPEQERLFSQVVLLELIDYTRADYTEVDKMPIFRELPRIQIRRHSISGGIG